MGLSMDSLVHLSKNKKGAYMALFFMSSWVAITGNKSGSG